MAEPRAETRREFVLVAFRMFAWMIAFLVLVTIGGYLAALLLFIPAFLLFVARARPRTAVIYTLVVALFILAIPVAIVTWTADEEVRKESYRLILEAMRAG